MLSLEQIKDLENIIKSKLELKNGCLEYPYVNLDGYGDVQFRINGKKHHILAHRAIFMIENNILLNNNDIILHTCDNPKCVIHLKLGTHNDNVQDKVIKNRQAKGENNGRSKLTWNEVREIRKSNDSNNKLGNLYGVDRKTIRLIKSNKIWKE